MHLRTGKFIFYILIIFLGYVNSLLSQSLKFQNFTSKDGLITDEIFNLHQDNKGYIWIFSKYGTLKYNGLEFKPVLNNLPFSDRFIYTIYENTKGQKWVANSNAKIYEIRNDSAFIVKGFENVSIKLKNSVSEIAEIAVDDSLNIYFSSKGFSYKLLRLNDSYRPIEISIHKDLDSVRIKVIKINGQLIYSYNRPKDDEFVFKNKIAKAYLEIENSPKLFKLDYLPFSIPYRHFKLFGKTIYFTYDNYLGKISEQNKLSYINIGAIILNYCKDENNHLWVGTLNNGLFEVNENDSVIGHYLINNTINDILIDRQSGLWASSSNNGLYYSANTNDVYFAAINDFGNLSAVVKNIEESIYVLNSKGALYTINNAILNKLVEGSNIPSITIQKFDKKLIITNLFSINTYSISSSGVNLVSTKKSEKIYDIIFKSKDTIIYVWRKGIIFEVNGVYKKRIDYGQKITSSKLIGNNLYLGTENGVFVAKANFNKPSLELKGILLPDMELIHSPSFLEETRGFAINKIVQKQSEVWFCTEGAGLFKLYQNQVTHFSEKDGLPSDIINNIFFLSFSDIILLTNKGIFSNFLNSIKDTQKFPNKANSKSLNSSKLKTSILNLTNWKKIYDEEVKDGAYKENKIYISSKYGLAILNIHKAIFKYRKTLFYLSNIKLDSKEVNCVNLKEVQSYQKSIQFKFDFVSFDHCAPSIKFKLLGPILDSGLIENRTIEFSRLSPGSYTLIACPKIENGASFLITKTFFVKPTIQQTWYFKLFIFLLITFMIGIIFRLVIRRRKKVEEMKLKNEQLLLEYKLISLKAQVNPHFMSNCLSAIQHIIIEGKNNKATYYISQFGLLLRNILEYSSSNVITLGQELNLLKIYVELEQLRFENQFNFEIKFSSIIDQEELCVPPLILNPIVENAIWHGLLPMDKKYKCKIMITLSRGEDYLEIKIADNGVGLSAKNNKESNTNKSFGINITEQRLTNLNYLFKSNVAKIIYKDLTSSDKEPYSTVVLIRLPIIIIS